jgi:hypothetical protein
MYYRLLDNDLVIFYTNGKVKENATQEQNECNYCINEKDCDRKEKVYGGSRCDFMKCILGERI